MVELGRAQLDLGQPDVAVAHLERAVLAAPNSPDAWVALAAAYALSGRLQDALEAYRSVRSCPITPAAAPTDRTLMTWRGAVGEAQMLRLLGRFDEAVEVLESLLEEGHDELEVIVTLAEVRRDQGDRASAIGLLQDVVSQDSTPVQVVELFEELVDQNGR
jgi:tetratricopeptide (TPR) repeat protein